ncbi:MAG TPA: hypothetical protein P5218_09715, partial [Planctomycetota bacterium]|nr:hypothetical protein [Planctomycetota bacterium]
QDAIAHVLSRSGKNTVYLREGSSNRPASRSAARAIAQPARIQLGPKERALLTLLRGAEPMSLKQIASQLRMGERRARRLLVPLLQAGYVHDRSERRYALTAPGAAQLDS